MSRVLVFGATGSLERHVLRQAVAAKHDVAVVVRSPAKPCRRQWVKSALIQPCLEVCAEWTEKDLMIAAEEPSGFETSLSFVEAAVTTIPKGIV